MRKVTGGMPSGPGRGGADGPPGWGERARKLPCHWVEEPDGSRMLVPGCWARVLDPDVEQCDCLLLKDQVERLVGQLAAAKRALASLRRWHDRVVRAVYDHPDSKQIMFAASQGAENG